MEEGQERTIVVGMSGGVDSSMALVLLKEHGWRPLGVSLRYDVDRCPKGKAWRENTCCTAESFAIAREVCDRLGVPYEIIDIARRFREEVINPFLTELEAGRTPNPCILCNKNVKFAELLRYADSHGAECVATGHYANIRRNPRSGSFELVSPRDAKKDQTYMLSYLAQEDLRRIVFPLAGFTKDEIKAMAAKRGFRMFEKRKESQDICFIGGAPMEDYLERALGEKKGIMIDTDGCKLGEHRGLHFYTIGQRKGISLPNGPYYVVRKEEASNTLVVSREEEDLCTRRARLTPFRAINELEVKTPIPVLAKIRYHHEMVPATLTLDDDGGADLTYDEPQKAMTPGQYAVCYARSDEHSCLGAGRIIRVQ